MTNNKGNQNDGLASSSSANLVNFEDANMDVIFTEDEIHKVAMEEEEGSDKVKDLLANLSMTPATNDHRRKKKYYRITQFPTKEMEAYYKNCPHPNEKQRRELAEELGLHHLQVVFWFKNKRKQMKNHLVRMENIKLRAENKNLKNLKRKGNICLCDKQADVTRLPKDHELRMENERLKKEYMKLLLMVYNLVFINYLAPIN